MTRFPLAAAVAATLVTACASTGSMPSDMTPSTRAEYVNMAAASDLFEIQSSQLALSKAQRPEVRDFAQMLITDHTNSTQQITAAATASGFTPPPPALMPNQAAMLNTLQNTSGADFDRTYLSQQVPAHQSALALHQNYARNGDTPALRTVAATVVPVVQSHLEHARQLMGR
jgi:putative membrane protein